MPEPGTRVSFFAAKKAGVALASGAPRAVEGVDLSRLAVADEHEVVAPHAVHVRANDGEDAGHGDRRVDRVAAALEDVGAHGAGEHMVRRDRTAGPHDIGAERGGAGR
jgi:hypothetical protein